jgi:tetratricopeptide (TPR) repeat protein
LNPEIVQNFYDLDIAVSKSDGAAIENASRKILSRIPDCIWALDLLGTALELEQQGRNDEAIECCEKVLNAFPFHSHAHFIKGLAMLKSGKNLKDTLAEFKITVNIDPENYKALNMLGECHRLKGDTSEAIKILQKSLEIHPESQVALMAISTALVECGQFDSAIQYINQAVRSYPNNPEIWEIKGDILAKSGYIDESLESWMNATFMGGISPRLFEKVKDLMPLNNDQNGKKGIEKQSSRTDTQGDTIKMKNNMDASIHYNNGNILYSEAKYTEALVEYQLSIQIDSNDAWAYNGLGMTYNKLHKHTEAISNFDHAIQIDVNHTQAYYNRGNSYFAEHKYKEALADYTQAIMLDSSLILAYINRGNTNDMLNHFENALADYTKAIQLDPHSALAYSNIGIMYAKANQPQKALPYFEKAIDLGDKSATLSVERVKREIGKKGRKGFISKLFGK